MQNRFDRIDRGITHWMARYGIRLLRISLGVIFLWFGVLKYFPGLSPAQEIASDTIRVLTLGWMGPAVSMPILATWECLIGLGLIFGMFLRLTILLLFLQMFGAVAPVFVFPERVFTYFPYVLTLEGQYIIKNAVLISAALVIGATVRGGGVVADPELARAAGTSQDQDELVD